ncbi:MAG: hypothetical protein M1832_005572 [Thelocarpon impressellum]|nr:MAG: hypothetical protein M1832_005572 [Thelocarpon impressellum]
MAATFDIRPDDGIDNLMDFGDDETYESAEEEEIFEEDEEPLSERSSASDEQPSWDQAEADSESDEESQVDPLVAEDMEKFTDTFKGIASRFRLINRIGEGTFSTVYKAEDLLYDVYDNDWDLEERDRQNQKWSSPPLKRRRTGDASGCQSTAARRPQYVAIKKIYVTSSPSRIQNELELLFDLRGCDSVCPLITAFRHQDQVVAVLPYFRHVDFRDYFRDFTVPDMRLYFRSLFTALEAVHKHEILHRDIKPTNFLYDINRQRGVLVDFGLAEARTDCTHCICQDSPTARRAKIEASGVIAQHPSGGYPKNDPRPSRRANRAGTRGFRAPEVLLKCTSQTAAIDVWSAGVILLTILSRRFPFFNSTDDIEALIEIATIFGARKMRACALLHGAVLETSIPTIGERGFSLEKIVLWSTGRTGGGGKTDEEERLADDEAEACRFLTRCLELDPGRRITAEEALRHDFLAEHDEEREGNEVGEEEELEML